MKRLIPPRAITGAFYDGLDRAEAWLDRADKPLPFASSGDWRAKCHADAVRQYEKRVEFLPLLSEWERGFDYGLRRAEAYYATASSDPLARTRSEIVERLTGQINAAAVLLSVFDALPETAQHSTLTACSGIVNDVARDLAALVDVRYERAFNTRSSLAHRFAGQFD